MVPPMPCSWVEGAVSWIVLRLFEDPQLVRQTASRLKNAMEQIVRFTLRVPPEMRYSAIMSGPLGNGQEKTPVVTHQSHCRHRLLALCTKGGIRKVRAHFQIAARKDLHTHGRTRTDGEAEGSF